MQTIKPADVKFDFSSFKNRIFAYGNGFSRKGILHSVMSYTKIPTNLSINGKEMKANICTAQEHETGKRSKTILSLVFADQKIIESMQIIGVEIDTKEIFKGFLKESRQTIKNVKTEIRNDVDVMFPQFSSVLKKNVIEKKVKALSQGKDITVTYVRTKEELKKYCQAVDPGLKVTYSFKDDNGKEHKEYVTIVFEDGKAKLDNFSSYMRKRAERSCKNMDTIAKNIAEYFDCVKHSVSSKIASMNATQMMDRFVMDTFKEYAADIYVNYNAGFRQYSIFMADKEGKRNQYYGIKFSVLMMKDKETMFKVEGISGLISSFFIKCLINMIFNKDMGIQSDYIYMDKRLADVMKE